MTRKLTISIQKLTSIAHQVSRTVLDISYLKHVSHIGSALSISDILTVLYFSRLHINSKTLLSENRDRFILSKGHAGAALYAVLYKRGILSKKQLLSFSDNEGLCEHPEITTPGVEMTSGSLGYGVGYGAGIAWGLSKKMNSELRIENREKNKLKIRNSQFTIQNSSPHVFVLISDGECGEGSVWEAALFAGRMHLDNLTVILDYNGWQCFGKSEEITRLTPIVAKWRSFGFATKIIDGHNIEEMQKAFKNLPIKKGKPSILIARTKSGHGIPLIENKLEGHFHFFTESEYRKAQRNLRLAYC